MEDIKKEEISHEEYKSLKKEGYAHLVVTKNDKKMLVYIQKDMPLNVAFDAAFDVSVHLREVYKDQLKKAMEENSKEKPA
ncbi:MAG: hypothetical protein R3230_01495 [Nitrosopumilaceae archaeon]|nr:hypothetical protein [Nitrosopumilaceae archaeon]